MLICNLIVQSVWLHIHGVSTVSFHSSINTRWEQSVCTCVVWMHTPYNFDTWSQLVCFTLQSKSSIIPDMKTLQLSRHLALYVKQVGSYMHTQAHSLHNHTRLHNCSWQSSWSKTGTAGTILFTSGNSYRHVIQYCSGNNTGTAAPPHWCHLQQSESSLFLN